MSHIMAQKISKLPVWNPCYEFGYNKYLLLLKVGGYYSFITGLGQRKSNLQIVKNGHLLKTTLKVQIRTFDLL